MDALKAVTAARDEAVALVDTKLHRRSELQAEIANIDAEVEDLRAEVVGFDRYLARHSGRVRSPANATPTTTDEGWQSLNRTDAIVKALDVLGKPASPKEIAAQLRQFGRVDDMREISRALNRLQKQGRVRSGGWGQWTPADPDAITATEEQERTSGEPRLPLDEPPSLNGMGHPTAEAVV